MVSSLVKKHIRTPKEHYPFSSIRLVKEILGLKICVESDSQAITISRLATDSLILRDP